MPFLFKKDMRLLRILFFKKCESSFFRKKRGRSRIFVLLRKKSHESSMAFLIFYLFHPKWGNKILKTYYPLRCNTNTSSSGIMVKIGGGGIFISHPSNLHSGFIWNFFFFIKKWLIWAFAKKDETFLWNQDELATKII